MINGKDRSYRIGLNTVERQAQLDFGQEVLSIKTSALSKDQDKILLEKLKTKKRIIASPQFAAMVDIDAFQESPPSIDPKDFVSTSLANFDNALLDIAKY